MSQKGEVKVKGDMEGQERQGNHGRHKGQQCQEKPGIWESKVSGMIRG